jgi:hypothetical protein
MTSKKKTALTSKFSGTGMKDRMAMDSEVVAEPKKSPHSLGDDAEVTALTPDQTGEHWSFKPQKRAVMKDANTRDSCPYTREDSKPECRNVHTLSRRKVLEPAPSMTTGAMMPTRHTLLDLPQYSVKKQHASRNFDFVAEMAKLRDGVQQEMVEGKPRSGVAPGKNTTRHQFAPTKKPSSASINSASTTATPRPVEDRPLPSLLSTQNTAAKFESPQWK